MKKLLGIVLLSFFLSGNAFAFQKFELKNCVDVNWGKKNTFNYYYNQNLKKIIMETMNDHKIIIKTEEIRVKTSGYGTDNTFNILAQNDEYIFWILQKEKIVIKTNKKNLILKEKCK